MIVKRIVRAFPKFLKISFDLATHPDANLVDARKAFTGGRLEEDDELRRERVLDELPLQDNEAFDLGTAPYQDPWEGIRDRSAAYDAELAQAERSWLGNIWEGIAIFWYILWCFLTVEAYCLVIARAMNAPTGPEKYQEFEDSRTDLRQRYGCYQAALREMHEGWLGISVPALAQYIKIMVVDGITVPKILASIYFSHWLVLEILLTLATVCNQNCENLTKDADTYLSNPYYHTSEVAEGSESPEAEAAGTNEDREAIIKDLQEAGFGIDRDPEVEKDEARLAAEIRRWPYDENENALMYIHMLAFVFGALIITPSAKSWKSAIFSLTSVFEALIPFHLNRYVRVDGKLDHWHFLRTGKRKKRGLKRKSDPTFGGYAVGGDLGLGCLIIWGLWCILFYGSNETSRPSWPWLDILG